MHDASAGSSLTGVLRGMMALVRPAQWVKNGFVLAPLVFAGRFLDPQAALQSAIAVLLFCLASSAAYIVNDLRDIESDRQHPHKRLTRPLAAGTVPVSFALALLAGLYVALAAAAFAEPQVMAVIALYLVINLAYSTVLKHQPVIDIFTVAIGFVLRVYAGALALDVPVSGWMFVTTLCLALYLAAVKRRQELLRSGAGGRAVLARYSAALVNRYAEMSATGALVFYAMFVMSARPQLVITVPLVLFGLFRYWYVVEEMDGGESPTDALLADWQLQLTVLVWIAACAWALWPGR